MFRVSIINIASLIILGILASMTAVFFACGDDDDDNNDNDDDDAGSCQDYLDRMNGCAESSYDFGLWWRMDPYGDGGVYDDSFLSWCNGGVYDPGSPWGYYDFIPGCFEGTCEEIYSRSGGWTPGDCVYVENIYG